MRTQLIIFLVSLAFAPVATIKRFQPWVCTAPAGPKSRQVEYQGIYSGSGFSPSRSETALCPANRPIGRACWHDITEVCPLSILAAAMSPAAYMSPRPLTFKNSSTGRRPQWSRSPGKRARKTFSASTGELAGRALYAGQRAAQAVGRSQDFSACRRTFRMAVHPRRYGRLSHGGGYTRRCRYECAVLGHIGRKERGRPVLHR